MKLREKLCAFLFEASKRPYRFLFKQKKEAWNLHSDDLINYPEGSLGKALGKFLKSNEFELIDKLESHDVYHVVCGMNTTVRDEVGMQFLLMGNGKRSLYLYATVGICFVLLPEYLSYFRSCYRKGKHLHPIHKLNLRKILNQPLEQIQSDLIQSSKSKQINFLNY